MFLDSNVLMNAVFLVTNSSVLTHILKHTKELYAVDKPDFRSIQDSIPSVNFTRRRLMGLFTPDQPSPDRTPFTPDQPSPDRTRRRLMGLFTPDQPSLDTDGFTPSTDIPGSTFLPTLANYTYYHDVLLSGSCPVITDFVNSFVVAIEHLQQHFTRNVNGAICRMTSPSSACNPPAVVIRTASNLATTTAATGNRASDTLVNGILNLVDSIFNIDLYGAVNKILNFLFETLPNRRASQTAADSSKKIRESLVCNYEAVQCTHLQTHRSVLATAFYIAAFMLLFDVVFSKLFFSLGFVYNVLCLSLFLPILFKVQYGVNFACNFVGAFPQCVVDDFVTTLDRWTPVTIPWPAPLINTTRLPNGYLPDNAIIDCSANPYGFSNGGRTLFYILERWAPGWRHYISGFSVGSIIGRKASNEMSYYYGKPLATQPFPACFELTVVNLIPVAVLLILALIFLFGAIQIIVTILTNLSRASDDAFTILALVYAEAVLLLTQKKVN
jgi:hypothetical protein